MYILMFPIVHHFKQHIALILIKILWRTIHCSSAHVVIKQRITHTMIISAGIGSADNHDGGIAVEQTKIANGRFEEMTVFLEPATKSDEFVMAGGTIWEG